MQVPSSQGSTSSEPREPGPRPPIHGVKAPRLLLARKVGEAPPEFQHSFCNFACVWKMCWQRHFLATKDSGSWILLRL